MTEDIYWRDGLISSQKFDDSYFSHIDGFQETQHVFLGGNQLPKRWIGQPHFAIAELGFGTGLNFLTTWRAFRQTNAVGVLSFTSFERYLITPDEMQQALIKWPEIQPYQEKLLAKDLPNPEQEGIHTIKLPQAELTLIVGDAREQLPKWEGQVNAWYLDGFAPNRNPELWEESLLQEVYNHTVPSGTAATYSAAGQVRRTLQTVGFDVYKVDGFANKREMLVAQKLEKPQ
ncbi:MAG: tRNA (5-methylaminomethyl-2-thiouridine)(34)-methyltransferase MnmD [Alphaproteobacteria bacterium]|nr:tRNA (5-methylaminomethyl-2-thiouridine)(34)-methyltransferase MnmD [Alphaproteobacteria bacterium]MDD9920305.1 tRNA (5-methylaminomethyl-2-thiouridine)(34)-methyltransferase MnmD [Alphaproteobacteria bacterium]